jgi:hypothetical protein
MRAAESRLLFGNLTLEIGNVDPLLLSISSRFDPAFGGMISRKSFSAGACLVARRTA